MKALERFSIMWTALYAMMYTVPKDVDTQEEGMG